MAYCIVTLSSPAIFLKACIVSELAKIAPQLLILSSLCFTATFRLFLSLMKNLIAPLNFAFLASLKSLISITNVFPAKLFGFS